MSPMRRMAVGFVLLLLVTGLGAFAQQPAPRWAPDALLDPWYSANDVLTGMTVTRTDATQVTLTLPVSQLLAQYNATHDTTFWGLQLDIPNVRCGSLALQAVPGQFDFSSNLDFVLGTTATERYATYASVPASVIEQWIADHCGLDEWRNQVLYFVFVDRWLNGATSNDGRGVPGVQTAANYQGGDWAGVTAKIEDGYFNDLGVTALWISVPADNPEVAGLGSDGHQYSAYPGYWPQNLSQTEERFGTLSELQGLVAAAHARNLRVVLDYVMNDVHISSPVFVQHPDWFWPSTLDGQSCICGSSACGWDSPYITRCWLTDYLPDFNFTNPQARAFSVSNTIWWLQQTGADGLRLDSPRFVETSWITDLRSRVKSDIEPLTGRHVFVVGDTFTGDPAVMNTLVNPDSMLDGQFEYPLRAQLVTSVLLRQGSMSELEARMTADENTFSGGLMSTMVGNHVMPRSIHFAEDVPLWSSAWADGKDRSWSNQPAAPSTSSAYERLAVAFAVIMTNRGVPLIYYGDEVGMPGAGDPDNRRFMQWSSYSAGQTLLQTRVKKLTAARAAHEALWKGARTTLSITTDTWGYRMTSGADTVYVAINRSDAPQNVSGFPSATLTDLLSGSTVSGPTIPVAPRTAMVLVP